MTHIAFSSSPNPGRPQPASDSSRRWTGPLAKKKFIEWGALGVSLAVAYTAAGVGGWLTSKSLATWYPGLAKPSWNPPDWVFGPVWTLLYTMMAIAAWLVWRSRRSQPVRLPLGLYAVQLVLNVLWSALFFALQSPGAAVGEILVLWLAIAATLLAFLRVDRMAGILIAPYWAWVSFATILNFAIWRLN
jgi:tryptophan-rich sensory protein